MTATARGLEPTDAVVVIGASGDVLAARGGAANFPLFWRVTGGSLVITTTLPIDEERRLSRGGLMGSLVVASVANQAEPNLETRTPIAGWFRARRGTVSVLSASEGCVAEHPIDLAESDDPPRDREEVILTIREAMDQFGRRLAAHPRAMVELSGGFDSTLAAIGVRAGGIDLLGVSITFPFYEFRFEEDIQAAVASSLQMSRVRLDGRQMLPFAPSDWLPRLDEPAIAVVALRQALTMARLAASEGLDRILVGHGGDQLFSEDLLGQERLRRPLERRAFSSTTWPGIDQTEAIVASEPPFMRRSAMTFLYDARFDVAFKEAFGTVGRTPFTDLAWVRAGLAAARLSARLGAPEGKRILAEAFAPELPSAVTARRGKVPWDGVVARAYAQHGSAIATEIEAARGPLECVGVDMRWLGKRVEELASGRRSTTAKDDREVIAAYALAMWLRSWGVQRVSDCGWVD